MCNYDSKIKICVALVENGKNNFISLYKYVKKFLSCGKNVLDLSHLMVYQDMP